MSWSKVVSVGVALCLSAVSAAHGAPPEQAKDAPKPNIILIVMDALRADRVAAERNGVPLMPNLKRFAEESLNFTRAVSPCSWTRPAVTSIFTSLHVDAHRVYFMSDPNNPAAKATALPKSVETMATYLKRAGYTTTGIQTNENLHASFGLAEGFDTYDMRHDARADWVTKRAFEEMGRTKEPLFLYLHYMDPHEPYDPPERYRTLLGCPSDLSPTDIRWIEELPKCALDMGYCIVGKKAVREVGDPSPRGRMAMEILYDGETKFLDDELGKLFKHLAEKQPQSLVIITADHGEEFWDHGFVLHSFTLYEEQLHVPLVIRGPGIKPRQATRPVETLGILPTIAELLGLPDNPRWQGKNLLSGAGDAPSPAFATTRSVWPSLGIHYDQVRAGDLKLILNRAANTVQLYDLSTDPQEKTNLASEQPDRVAELRALLEKHRQDTAKHAEESGHPDKADIEPEVVERLRSLGYL